MRFTRRKSALTLLLASAMLFSACSTTSTKVTKILDDPDYRKARFNNVLVIAVAADYNRRAQFERTVVSGIRKTGAEATAYYTVVGHNPPVSSSDIMNAVRARNIDAVVFTRVTDTAEEIKKNDASPDAQATVVGGNLFDLFRYDYKEYSEPENFRLSSSIVLVSQLYATAAKKNVWAIEIRSSDRESTDNIVQSAATALINHLVREKLVGPK